MDCARLVKLASRFSGNKKTRLRMSYVCARPSSTIRHSYLANATVSAATRPRSRSRIRGWGRFREDCCPRQLVLMTDQHCPASADQCAPNHQTALGDSARSTSDLAHPYRDSESSELLSSVTASWPSFTSFSGLSSDAMSSATLSCQPFSFCIRKAFSARVMIGFAPVSSDD